MATKLQIAANRRNSRKSTGPYTPEGKLKSAFNGVKHGLNQSPPHELVIKYLEPYAQEHGVDISNAHQTDLGRALLAIATSDAQIDRVFTVIAQAPTHEEELRDRKYFLEWRQCFSGKNYQEAALREGVKMFDQMARQYDRMHFSNPKALNRYLNAAINARRKAMKRLNALLSQFSETKPIST